MKDKLIYDDAPAVKLKVPSRAVRLEAGHRLAAAYLGAAAQNAGTTNYMTMYHAMRDYHTTRRLTPAALVIVRSMASGGGVQLRENAWRQISTKSYCNGKQKKVKAAAVEWIRTLREVREQ